MWCCKFNRFVTDLSVLLGNIVTRRMKWQPEFINIKPRRVTPCGQPSNRATRLLPRSDAPFRMQMAVLTLTRPMKTPILPLGW